MPRKQTTRFPRIDAGGILQALGAAGIGPLSQVPKVNPDYTQFSDAATAPAGSEAAAYAASPQPMGIHNMPYLDSNIGGKMANANSYSAYLQAQQQAALQQQAAKYDNELRKSLIVDQVAQHYGVPLATPEQRKAFTDKFDTFLGHATQQIAADNAQNLVSQKANEFRLPGLKNEVTSKQEADTNTANEIASRMRNQDAFNLERPDQPAEEWNLKKQQVEAGIRANQFTPISPGGMLDTTRPGVFLIPGGTTIDPTTGQQVQTPPYYMIPPPTPAPSKGGASASWSPSTSQLGGPQPALQPQLQFKSNIAVPPISGVNANAPLFNPTPDRKPANPPPIDTNQSYLDFMPNVKKALQDLPPPPYRTWDEYYKAKALKEIK